MLHGKIQPTKVDPRRWNFRFLSLFLEKGPIHGLPYVGKMRLTLLERILWLILTFVALYFSIHLALQSLHRFKTKSTVISIERDYHYWNTTMPSITICPMKRLDDKKFEDYCAEKGINGSIKSELFDFLESLANSSYFNFNDIKEYPSIDKLNIDPMDYMYIIYNLTEDVLRLKDSNRIHAAADSIVIHSQQVLTEWGICYSTNNFLIDDLSTSSLLFGKPADPNPFEYPENLYRSLDMNIFDDEAILNFMGFSVPISIFVHGAYEVMQIERRRPYTETPFECTAKVLNIIASDNFGKSTTVEQRQCRFPHETNLTHFPIYTRNICYQECRINLAYKLCKCIPHFYPNYQAKKPVCHYKVLKSCLFKYAGAFENLNEIKKLDLDEDAIQCNCLPNCRTSEVVEKEWKSLTQVGDLIGGQGVIVFMKQYPRLRYQRQIIFTLTDLLVSVGGTAGFFLGSSVLSAVEIIYYFTVRLVWYCFGYKE